MRSDELISLEVLGSDDELRAAAADTTDRVAAATEAAEVEGRDATRAVTVRIDRRGRVTDVLISAWWRDNLTPSGLQDAILDAYRVAMAAAIAAIDPTASSDRTTTPALPPADDAEDDRAWFEQIRRRLDLNQDRLDHSARLLSDAHPAERVLAGPAGLVRLVLSGSTVSQVQIDIHTALQESPNRLAADALAAFQGIH